MIEENCDRVEAAIGLVNHVWLTTLADAKYKERARLTHVNHMWDRDRPYWYLWFDDCSGVYKMELQRSKTAKGYDWIAEFTIKYYPSETEPSFHKLSTLEKMCRTSAMFHSPPSYGVCDCPCQGLHHSGHEHRIPAAQATGAPHVTFHDVIPAGFFYVGDMVIAHHERIGSTIRIQSQTSWKTVLQQDFTLRDDAGEVISVLKKGEQDKDFPGFAVCQALYRKVVATWSGVHQYTCEDEFRQEAGGFVFLSDGTIATPSASRDVKKMIVQAALRRHKHDKLESLPMEGHSMTESDGRGCNAT